MSETEEQTREKSESEKGNELEKVKETDPKLNEVKENEIGSNGSEKSPCLEIIQLPWSHNDQGSRNSPPIELMKDVNEAIDGEFLTIASGSDGDPRDASSPFRKRKKINDNCGSYRESPPKPLKRKPKKEKENADASCSRNRVMTKIVGRCFPGQVVHVLQTIKKNDEKYKAIKSMGFESLFHLPNLRLRTDLLKFLITHFDPNSCSLRIANEQLHISDIDVHLMFGIPLGNGSEVQQYGRYKPTEVQDVYFNDWLQSFRNEIPKNEALKDAILSDTEGGDSFKRNFVVFLVSNLLAPITNPKHCNWRVVKSLKETSKIKDFNWCSFVLYELVNKIRDFKTESEENKLNVGGCLLFLELFYLDRFHHGGQPTLKRQGIQPRMVGWTNEMINNRLKKELKHANSFGYGKIVDDPLRLNIEMKRIKEEMKPKATEEDEIVELNFSQDVERFEEVVDDIIQASHECQKANKLLFEKIRRAEKAFPSQTASICEHLRINAPAIQEDDAEYTTVFEKTINLISEVWIKAKESFQRQEQRNNVYGKEVMEYEDEQTFAHGEQQIPQEVMENEDEQTFADGE